MQKLEQKLQDALFRNRELELKNKFLRSDNDKLQSNVEQLQSARARARGRKGGRPRKMDSHTLMMAIKALEDKDITV